MNGAKIRRKKKDRVREDMKKHVYFFFFSLVNDRNNQNQKMPVIHRIHYRAQITIVDIQL